MVDHYFSLGSHLNAHDVKAVRKTVAGLVKLIYPDGQVTKEEMLDVSADIMERVDPIFYGDPLTAAMKALGVN